MSGGAHTDSDKGRGGRSATGGSYKPVAYRYNRATPYKSIKVLIAAMRLLALL